MENDAPCSLNAVDTTAEIVLLVLLSRFSASVVWWYTIEREVDLIHLRMIVSASTPSCIPTTHLPMVLVTRNGPTPFSLLFPSESNSPPCSGMPALVESTASVTSSIDVPP